jgi:hypothetical protein
MKIEVALAVGKTTDTAVTNKRGGMLLPEGFVLTEDIIAALTKQGITHVDVLDETGDKPLSIVSNKKVEHIERLLNDFTTPNMTELKQCLINQIQN